MIIQRNNDIMVRIPKFNLSDVIDGALDTPHPAFIVGGKEVPGIWVSKYQNIIVGSKAYSLPFQQPAVNVDYDQAREACESKGPGWHLISNAEWAAIALWAKKNGTLPRGNNNRGGDHSHDDE
ncbi:ATPase, partial [Paenibacillus popilliae ATCC 14706]